jgi:hypothetical protein
MPRSCTVCCHPDRAAIDRELVTGTAFPAIAAKYRVSADAVGRHKAGHLLVQLVKAHAAEDASRGDDLLDRLESLTADARRIGKKAEANGDYRTALMGIRELVRIVEVLAELRGELDRRPVNILVMPEWVGLRAGLLAALQPFPEARAAVAAQIMLMEAS